MDVFAYPPPGRRIFASPQGMSGVGAVNPCEIGLVYLDAGRVAERGIQIV